MRFKNLNSILAILISCLLISGCTITFQKRHRTDVERISALEKEVELLNLKLDELKRKKEFEMSDLEKARKLLEQKLKKEIDEKQVRLEMAERGLAIIFLAEVLFDSGKAKIREEAISILDKVSVILEENVGDRDIGIEGHTDNEPIKYSGWRSNWELSTGRATSVLHYLVDEKGIQPKRVSAIGYGEYRPVASNDTPEGRRENRRVEIVILPKGIEKIKSDMEKLSEQKERIQKELKRYKK